MQQKREKFFNTAGPIQKDIHYSLDPLSRWDLDSILTLIHNRKYFVLHAPRQTGKTTGLLSLMDYLNKSGDYHAVYANIETAQTVGGDVGKGIHSIISSIDSRLSIYLSEIHQEIFIPNLLEKYGAHDALRGYLTEICKRISKPLILFLDEVDALIGDPLISLLRQMRNGYDLRPFSFPQSVIFCGVRDVRDYRIHSASSNEIITGGSAFNVKSESLTLGNFSQDEITTLYQEHTHATGQTFADGVLDIVWRYTAGQPYLVNALAYEACFRSKENRDRNKQITVSDIEQAKESLITQRVTHLDQLTDKLKEDRVRNVVEPIMAGFGSEMDHVSGDVQYVLDLGLIRQEVNGKVDIANELYREIIPRELAWQLQPGISQERSWYMKEDGSLDLIQLISAFQEFFRENSEHWIERFQYKEAGPHLILQAFLQRIINGGGMIEREYGLGRMRTDIFIRWFYGSQRYQGKEQKIVIECKVLYKSMEKTLTQGLEQTSEYMDKCGSNEGHLIIFDRSPETSWEAKIWRKDESYQGKKITVWGM